ncbi:TetR/AcrR family transcriptional regulator [Prolixibacter sp. NT017]|uniref:TetR/AcrR family transcriptional regulator n=1 Tax=Prolixibacter sp. NT017 TaxID=2652390 RepID=UPI0012825387|nr:TetR/AcrR family transcriptional regulator [Prolixibacter sp. NT017]GET24425.1 TetR family transcriptional regulator [Prolixibacter sp. NT017]
MPRNKSYSDDIVLGRAMQVFWNYGYEATSVRMLEKEMNINQFSIYSSFQNKKNLFVESIRNYREYVKKHRFQVLLQKDAGLAELEQFLQNSVQKVNQNDSSRGCLVVNTAAEIGNKDEDIAIEINRYYDFIREMLKNVLLNAVSKGEVSPNTDVEKQASFFLGVMQGLSVAKKTMDKNQLADFIAVAIKQIK